MLFYGQFLHVQLSPFHSFINLLNFATDSESFIVSFIESLSNVS